MKELTELISKSSEHKYSNLSGDWLNIDFPKDLKALVYSTLEYLRPEILFYQLFSIVVKKNFIEMKRAIVDRKTILNLYNGFSNYILENYCEVGIEGFNPSFDIYEWEILDNNLEKHIIALKNSMIDFVMYDENRTKELGILPNDFLGVKVEGDKLFQNVMLIGCAIATSRIIAELDNDNYIGAEFIEYNNSKQLLIYLTPYGMINHKKIIGPKFNGGLEYYQEFLEQNSYQLVTSSFLRKEFNSNQILEYKGETYAHVKEVFDYSNDFIIDWLNQSYSFSLLANTQVNFKKMRN